jgi:hypothetical protein
MIQNYCEIKKNKIYGEIFDELLDEELSMYNKDHNNKIKNFLEKKIINSNYINISNNFTNRDDILEDIILKITSDIKNDNLQGNTLLMYADENSIYELFHMEDLTKQMLDENLNEFSSLTNIFLQPVCWGAGIFKSSYINNEIKGDIITKQDISKLFISNFYHIGVMINLDNSMLEIEFTGEDPYKIIGPNFVQSNMVEILSFNIIPFIEKSTNKVNEIGSKLLDMPINGRLFLSLICPNSNKKFWDITINTIKNILLIMDNKDIQDKIHTEIEMGERNINPFYLLKKYLIK